VTSHTLDEESDGQLLRRFAEERDERAFALLVERRGALVLGVCARMLRNRADADDAFQAVFLVAARRASALRRSASLAGWLHNVAVRVSLNALRANRRRHRHVQEAADVRPEIDQSERLDALKQFIDEELAALPEQLREVVVLCDLEGRTRGEVAQLLSLPASTVTDRLHRGRELMRKRLIRKGLTVAAGGAAFGLAWCGPAAPAVAADLVRETVRNADAFVWGTAAARATLSTQIVTLAEGALHAMLLAQWKVVVCFVAILTASMLGGAMAPSGSPFATTPAVAGPYFLDDFEDGSATDGMPVTWAAIAPWDTGTFVVVGDVEKSLAVTPGGPGIEGEMDVEVVGRPIRGDLRILTRVLVPRNNIAAVFARNKQIGPSDSDIFQFIAGINASGQLGLTNYDGRASTDIATVSPGFDPFAKDVNLEFEIVGDVARLKAWPEGTTEPPTAQLTVDISSIRDFNGNKVTEGSVGVLAFAPSTPTTSYFRFFQAVPEPCTNYLAASMIGATGFGFLFQRWRRNR